jgi:hypothetical protein
MSGSKSVDNGVRIVDVTGDGLPDFLLQPAPVLIHDLQTVTDDDAHCKISGKPSPLHASQRPPLTLKLNRPAL